MYSSITPETTERDNRLILEVDDRFRKIPQTEDVFDQIEVFVDEFDVDLVC